jgi:hypothetical protein
MNRPTVRSVSFSEALQHDLEHLALDVDGIWYGNIHQRTQTIQTLKHAFNSRFLAAEARRLGPLFRRLRLIGSGLRVLKECHTLDAMIARRRTGRTTAIPDARRGCNFRNLPARDIYTSASRMALGFGTIIYVSLLLTNAIAILSEERFLARSEYQAFRTVQCGAQSLVQLAGQRLNRNQQHTIQMALGRREGLE